MSIDIDNNYGKDYGNDYEKDYEKDYGNGHPDKETNSEHSISTDLPIGFGLSLAADEKAMNAFAEMSSAQKKQVIEDSKDMHTKQDMEAFVHKLGESYMC